MIMKKLFLSLGLALSTLLSTNATTLVIENNCHTYVCIDMIQTTEVNGVSYSFLVDSTCMFVVDGNGDTYYATDGDANNFQFPFLNTFPFSGYVLEGPGQTSNLPLATLPLPYIGDWPINTITQSDRHQFEYMKFTIKGAYGDGFGPELRGEPVLAAQGYLKDDANHIGSYYSPAGEDYEVTYFAMFGIYYFNFDDNI